MLLLSFHLPYFILNFFPPFHFLIRRRYPIIQIPFLLYLFSQPHWSPQKFVSCSFSRLLSFFCLRFTFFFGSKDWILVNALLIWRIGWKFYIFGIECFRFCYSSLHLDFNHEGVVDCSSEKINENFHINIPGVIEEIDRHHSSHFYAGGYLSLALD